MNMDYKNLLNITPHKEEKQINILDVWMAWDSNDGDYIEKSVEIKPEVLFNNKKLIYCLAYITLPYDFKGHEWNDAAFEHYITDNEDIDDLIDVLEDSGFCVYCECGMCHSCGELNIVYNNENGEKFNITFDDIHKEWESMSYQEICDFINSIDENE